MNENKRIKFTNSIVLLTGIAFICISIQFFYSKKDRSLDKIKSIGEITFSTNDIRLKRTQYFEWFDIEKTNKKISINDKVFSNKNSNAKLTLSSGHEIKVKEQSLIKIKDASTIKIRKGIAQIKLKKGQKPLNLIINQRTIQLRSESDSTVSVKSGDKTTIELQEGSVELKSKLGVLNLKKGTPILIKKDKAITSTELHSPLNTTILTTAQRAKVFFQFSPKKPNSMVTLSESLDFKGSRTLTAGKEHFFSPGLYYWKVQKSTPAFFKVIKEVSPPSILLPAINQDFFIFSKSTSIEIQLKNQGQQPQALKTLALYNSSHKFIKEVSTKKNKIFIKDINEGSYYLKTKQENTFTRSKWSSPVNFKISRATHDETKAMVIELKKPNQKVKFEWNKPKNELSLFEVSPDPNFKNIIISKRIRTRNFTHVTFPVIGTFYWRSQRLNKDGKKVNNTPIKVIIRPTPPPSKPKSLPSIKLKVQSKNSSLKNYSTLRKLLSFIISSAHADDDSSPTKPANKKLEPVKIKFPKIENAKSYNIQIFSNRKMTRPIKTVQTNKTHFKWLPPKAGTYYWRIQYQDHWSRTSPFSDLSTIKVEFNQSKQEKRLGKVENKKKIKTPVPSNLRIKFLIGPNSISYSQKLQRNVSIEGSIYDSKMIRFEKGMNSKYIKNFSISYASYGGLVFDNQNFQARNLLIDSELARFNLTILASLKQLPLYKINTGSEVISDGHFYQPSLGIKYSKALKVGKSHFFKPALSILSSGAFDYNLALSYEYFYNIKNSLLLSVDYYNGQIESQKFDVNYQYFQLLTGLQRSF